MAPRTGRPKSDNPKRTEIKARMDDEAVRRLDEYCQKHGVTRSDAVRQAIERLLGDE